jgi:hypothetical protein
MAMLLCTPTSSQAIAGTVPQGVHAHVLDARVGSGQLDILGSTLRGSTGPPKSVVNTNPLSVHPTRMGAAGSVRPPERVFGVFRGPPSVGCCHDAPAVLHFCIT